MESRRNIALLLMMGIVLAVIATFFLFTYFVRDEIVKRREARKNNLAEIYKGLDKSLKESKPPSYPDRLEKLYPKYVRNPQVFRNPSWPETFGYIYIAGAQESDSNSTVLVYENVPESKKRAGRFVLTRDGEIKTIPQKEFDDILKSQEQAWQKTGRNWRPQAIDANLIAPATR